MAEKEIAQALLIHARATGRTLREVVELPAGEFAFEQAILAIARREQEEQIAKSLPPKDADEKSFGIPGIQALLHLILRRS